MIKMSLLDMKEKIIKEAKITEDDLNSKIKKKTEQLAGLVSEEGACHIIANELGVKLFSASGGRMKIKNLLPGMKNFELAAKVTRKFEPREFDTGERQGRVGNIMAGDETGLLRVVFWNDYVDKMNDFNENDILLIKDAYIKDNNGRKEIHLNDRSNIEVNPEGETVEAMTSMPATRKKLKELKEDEFNVEILGTIVQMFEPRYFEVCPECGKRTRPQEGNRYVCEQHGEIIPKFSYIVNVVIDDGTDSMRVACFRDQAQKLLGKSDEEVLHYRDNVADFEDLKQDILGNIVKVIGRVKKNIMFDRVEFTAQQVDVNPNPEEEIKRLNSN